MIAMLVPVDFFMDCISLGFWAKVSWISTSTMLCSQAGDLGQLPYLDLLKQVDLENIAISPNILACKAGLNSQAKDLG